MRCKRCHAVIAEGRKTCPNCGTLIRKKRGNITLSNQSGVQVNRFADGISDGLYNLKVAVRRDSRILIMLVALPLIVLGIILLLCCGASSCACTCTSLCSSEKTSKVKYEVRENSREPSAQFVLGDTLYYISDGSIMSRSADESYRNIYNSVSASDLQSDGEYLYFREGNLVKRIALNGEPVSGSDIAETELDFSMDTNYTLGYFLAEGRLFYYLKENDSNLTTLYSDTTVKSGKFSDMGYMKGKIYYTVSESDMNKLYSMDLDGGNDKVTVSGILDYQLGGGYIYAITQNTSGSKMLARYDEKGTLVMEWDITALTGGEITSIAANDAWLCFVTASESGSVVYRIEHDSNDIASVFAYSDTIELTGVSGDWYAFESIKVDDKKEIRAYSIRNSRNGKSAL